MFNWPSGYPVDQQRSCGFISSWLKSLGQQSARHFRPSARWAGLASWLVFRCSCSFSCSCSCPALGKQHVGHITVTATSTSTSLAPVGPRKSQKVERNSLVLCRHVLLLVALAWSEIGVKAPFVFLASPTPNEWVVDSPGSSSIPMTMMSCVLVPEHWISFAAEIIYDEICITLPSNKGNALRFAWAACSASLFNLALSFHQHLVIEHGLLSFCTPRKRVYILFIFRKIYGSPRTRVCLKSEVVGLRLFHSEDILIDCIHRATK